MSMVALAAGVLAITAGCMGTVTDGEPYHIRQSGIQVLQTEGADCDVDHGTDQAAEDTEEVRFTLTSEQNVDTAYARIKQAFGFQAPDERAPGADTQPASAQQNTTYHHRMAPGVGYSMRERREINGHTGVIQIDIERGENGSRLTVLYDAGGKDGFPRGEGFRRLVESKAREALR